MQKFTINESIKFIDEFYYCTFYPNDDFYDDKYVQYVSTTDLLSIDKEAIRVNIYNNLADMYPQFINEYYL